MIKNTNTIAQHQNYKKDTVEISKTSSAMLGMLDKGTAAHTTLYVDYSTFQQIANYTTNNSECPWSEIGIDGEKRWIVINGQRFESPLSKEEKEAFRKACSSTLLDVLEQHEKEKEKFNHKSQETVKVDINFTGNTPSMNGQINNTKIINLLGNEKVMKMLKDISKLNGGKISLSTTP